MDRSRYNESQTIFNSKELILKGLHVPFTLRSEILNILDQGHIGIDRTKLHAQNKVYWPGLSNDITKLISN